MSISTSFRMLTGSINYYNMEKDLSISHEVASGFDIYDPKTGEITFIDGESC